MLQKLRRTKRSVCFVITSEIHYIRNKLILENLKKHPAIDLKIVLGGSALLPRYSNTCARLEQDGYTIDARATMLVEGGNLMAAAKTTGLGVLEFANAFERIKPDVVLVRGDRYEVLAAVVAAANLNMPLAHIEGGDASGTLDEGVRHAITKLAHIHFTTNTESRARVLQMGEAPDYVFDAGSPEVEYVEKNEKRFSVSSADINARGVGGEINLNKPYIVLFHHPVATEYGKNKAHTEVLIEAVDELAVQTIWFWPNPDAGSDEVTSAVRRYHEQKNPSHVRFLKYIDSDAFYALLKGSACLLGNSSAGIKEGSYLGVPVVNIGSRQKGRARAQNVRDVEYDKARIVNATQEQIAHGVYQKSPLYFKEQTSSTIANVLSDIPLYTQKKFHDN